MKLIGTGWQYKVYDLGNGRVLKEPLTLLEGYRRAYTSPYSPSLLNLFASFAETFRVRKVTKDTIAQLKIRARSLPMDLFANPSFTKGVAYEQDLVIPLDRYISEHSFEENKQILLAYAELVIKLWKLGIADVVYNFSLNSGVDSNGHIVQMDIGELSFSKEEVLKTIIEKFWLRQSSYTLMQDGLLKDFYKEAMERVLTAKSLEECWLDTV